MESIKLATRSPEAVYGAANGGLTISKPLPDSPRKHSSRSNAPLPSNQWGFCFRCVENTLRAFASRLFKVRPEHQGLKSIREYVCTYERMNVYTCVFLIFLFCHGHGPGKDT